MTAQSSQSVLINGFGVLFVILNSFGLGLRLSVGKLLAGRRSGGVVAGAGIPLSELRAG